MDVIPAVHRCVRQLIGGPLLICFAALALSDFSAQAETQIPVERLPSASSGVKAQEQVDGATGSFTQTIPIEVPSFFGIEPKLALSYDWRGGNGPLGMGWRVDGLSVIQRASPRRGVPTYDSTDIYLLDGQELVPCGETETPNASCSAGGTHATKIESFLRVTRIGLAAWILRARDGTALTYLPLEDEQDYRWRLSTVQDTHGNTVTYNYACPEIPDLPNQPNIPPFIFNSNEPECYIDTIAYNQTTVTFHREQRPDIFTYNRGAGLVQASSRFKTIAVETAGLKVRAYKFLYNFVATGTQRRRLASVQQFGRDYTLSATGTVESGASLPPVTLGYTGAATSFSSTRWATGQGAITGTWVTGDFNGDGRTDFAQQNVATCKIQVRLSNGSAFLNQQWTVTPVSGTACVPAFSGTWDTGDFNIDGKTDFVVYCCEGGNMSAYVYQSTGTAFSFRSFGQNLSAVWRTGAKWVTGDIGGDGATDLFQDRVMFSTSAGCFIDVLHSQVSTFAPLVAPVTGTCTGSSTGGVTETGVTGITPGDFNGDGATDFIRVIVPDGQTNGVHIEYFRNTGSSFYRVPLQTSVEISGGGRWFVADVNGDGQLDVVSASGGTIQVYLLNGGKWIVQNWANDPPPVPALNETWKVGDVNGDGRMDLIVHSNTQAAVDHYVFVSLGTSFVLQNWGSAMASPNSAVGDFNGDGRTDVAAFWNSGGWTADVHLASGPVADLLFNVVNSLGGITSVTSTPSTTWSNTYLPVIFQTVASLTTNDGRNTSTSVSTTNFQYTEGFWHVMERRFRGFRTVTATLPCITGETTPCPFVTTTYLRAAAHVAARVERVQEKNGAGALLRERVEEYALSDTADLPYTSFNTASWRYIHVGATNKRTKVTRIFDVFGNVKEETQHGNFAITGDELTTAIDFYPNLSPYIVSLPGRSRTFAGMTTAGTRLAEQRVYYDNVAAYTSAPILGNAKKTEAWLNTLTPPNDFVATTYEHDSFGNVTARIDPLNRRTEYIYSTNFHTFLWKVRDPLYFAPTNDTRYETAFSWSISCALPLDMHDVNGQQTTFAYDQLCRSQRTDRPGGDFTEHLYTNIGTAAGQWIETWSPPADTSAQQFTRTLFDGYGRTWREVTEGLQTAVIFVDRVFDLRGNVASETAPYYNGIDTTQWTNFKYDPLNRRIERKHPDNAIVGGSYALSTVTGAFERATVTDELNRPATVHTDAYGRVIQRDEKLGATTVLTKYQYDLLGRLTRITDHANNQWNYTYDSLGRRLTASDPDLGLAPNNDWTYQYDNVGQLIEQTDALGQRTRLTYDELGRVTKKEARYLHATLPTETTDYTYDQARPGFFNVGQLTTASNAAATIEYSYDGAGRLRQKSWLVGGAIYTMGYTYDTGGRLRSQTYPDGDSVGSISNPITYDVGGRLKSVPGLINDAFYNARSAVTSLVRANAVTTTFGYSLPRGWLTDIDTTATSGTIQDIAYTRGPTGRINAITSPGPNSESWTFGYDDLDRLLCANNWTGTPTSTTCTATGGSATLRQNFTYNPVGNMLTNRFNGATSTYAYPTSGVNAVRPHAVTSISGGPLAGQTFLYDANGNMICQAGSGPTCSGGDTRIYDGQSRLANATDGAMTTQFAYGPDGARLKKTPSSGTTILYLGADIEIVGWSGSGTGVMYKYLPGGAKRESVTTYWLHRDHLGSLRGVTDVNGSAKLRAQYRPFGEQLDLQVPLTSESKGYIGERHDDETGLLYLNARYYDPVLGRFLQADPASPIAAGVGINRYAYAANSPIMRLDPTGLADGPDPISVVINTAHDALGASYQFAQDVNLGTRVGGALNFVGGVGEGVVGLAACATGFGCIFGGAAYTHGVDVATAGVHEMWSGQDFDTNTSVALQSAGVPRGLANGVDAGASVVLTLGAAAAPGYLRAGAAALGADDVIATAGPRLIGRVEPPIGLVAGSTDFGNAMHQKIAGWIQANCPGCDFVFRVRPGQTGIDVLPINASAKDFLGGLPVEIKPQNVGEVMKAMRQNADNWNYPEFRIWGYDASGQFFDNGVYTLSDETLSTITGSAAP